jgi:hypothetical protein
VHHFSPRTQKRERHAQDRSHVSGGGRHSPVRYLYPRAERRRLSSMRRPPFAKRPRTRAWPSRPITSAVEATGDGDAGGGPATTTTTTGITCPTTATMVTTGDIAGVRGAGTAGVGYRAARLSPDAGRRFYLVRAACIRSTCPSRSHWGRDTNSAQNHPPSD